ncbi:L-type lectin-domain containing receptor kinase IX.1 [Glycine soja]|nr:L-type lectin-domain containing receptor kinase IX.1 [Glycine soja]
MTAILPHPRRHDHQTMLSPPSPRASLSLLPEPPTTPSVTVSPAPRGYRIPPNPAVGTLGLFNATTNVYIPNNHVHAVEFDTFNGTIDPPFQHVGIDDNSLKSVAVAEFDIDRNLGNKCNALINYTASSKTLFVSWSFNNSNSNTSLSYKIDLMDILPEWVDVGFSAATGQYTQRNVIHSWEFSSSTASKKHNNNVLLIVVVTCSTVLVVVVVAVKFDLDRATLPRRFDYKELVVATKGFADDVRLGRGSSGQVYKGFLSGLGRVVAVKRIFTNFENSERVFINEVRIISRLILMHRNLVQFIGWCHEQGEFLLVFEFMPNGSLDTHLFGEKKTLAWDIRYKVALGVVLAFRYHHEDAEQSVLHRDIKSANVLLDMDFSTKLGDFGMAKMEGPRLRTQRTGVVGTYGYLAPEYINGEGNVLGVVDERLNNEFDVDEITSMIVVGLWCTNPNDKERPKAAQVIKVLQLEAPLPVLPLDMHNASHPSLVTDAQSTYNSSYSVPFTNSFVSVGR